MSRNPYLDVLRVPGTAAFSAAGALARLPISMVTIGAVLMIQIYTGSYETAGRIAAVLAISSAVGSPQVARFVDRRGQHQVLRPLLAATTTGLIGLIITAWLDAPEPWLWLCAIVAGASQGSYGSYVRARWVHALDDPRRLHTAFSLESVIDELVFVVGPALATVLATNVIAPGGIIVAVAAGVTGGLIFLSLRGTEPPPRRSDGTDAGARSRADAPSGNVSFPRPAIAYPGMPVIALVFVAMGTFFGSNDVSAVAFAEEHGSQTAAGLLLAIIAFGSLVAGLGYGAVHWRSRLSVRFAIGCVAIAIGVSWYNTAHSITSLAVVMFFAGFSVSPTVITGNAIVQALIPPHRLTEGLAWVGTSIGAGFALGSWLAGARIDAVGASGGFWVATISGWVCALLALAVLPSLRNKERVER